LKAIPVRPASAGSTDERCLARVADVICARGSPMQTDFGPEVLLVFVGHSDDAEVVVNNVMGLEHDLQRELEHLLNVTAGKARHKVVRLWAWSYDAKPGIGGQDAVITPVLDRADIAVFIFNNRIGTVTWQELERARRRKGTQVPILAFFPTAP